MAYHARPAPGSLSGWRRTAALILLIAFVVVPVALALAAGNL